MPLSTKIINALRRRSTERPNDDSPDAVPSKTDELAASAETHEVAPATAENSGQFEKSHQWDPNLPQEDVDALHMAEKSEDPEGTVKVDHIPDEDSPYPDVRAAVRNKDNDDEVANTVRAWILGMISVTIGGGLNMFLSMRCVGQCPSPLRAFKKKKRAK